MTFVAAGCSESVDTVLRFEPSGSLASAPYPDSRYRAGGQSALAQYETMPFLRQLDRADVQGFSPTTRIRIPFQPSVEAPESTIDIATADAAIRLYDVSGVVARRVPLAEFRLRRTTSSVTFRPATPLDPGKRYAVVVVSGWLRTQAGGIVTPSAGYQALVDGGDPVTADEFAKVVAVDPDISGREATDAFFTFEVGSRHRRVKLLRDIIAGSVPAIVGDAAETLVVADPNTTDPMALWLRADAVASDDKAIDAAFQGAGLDGARGNTARVVRGMLRSPDFLAPLDLGLEDPEWGFHTIEGEDGSQAFDVDNPPRLNPSRPLRTIPYLLFLPTLPVEGAAEPVDVVVAMHGFEGRKEDWFAMAEAVNARGMALIAVDAYQHGERQTSAVAPEGGEKLLDASVVARNPELAFPDPFLNPTFLERTEGKWLQSAADVLALLAVLRAAQETAANPVGLDWDGDGVVDRVGRLCVTGISLGAMLGTAVAAVSPEVERVALYGVGGGLSDLARDSQTLGIPLTLLMLRTANVDPFGLLAGLDTVMLIDRPEREVYGIVTDAILAAVDAANHAGALVDGRERGDGGANVLIQATEFDLLVPNNATERLIRAMASALPDGAVGVTDTEERPALFASSAPPVSDPSALRVRLSQYPGTHGVLLDGVDPAATASAQAEVVDFLAAP